jgi:hypothetical protein
MVVPFMMLQFSIFVLMMCFSFISLIEFVQSLNLIQIQISFQMNKGIWKSNRFSLLIWPAAQNIFLLQASPPGPIFPSPVRCSSWPSGHCHCLNPAPPARGFHCPCSPPHLVLFTAGQPEPPMCTVQPGQPVTCSLCPCRPGLIPCSVKTFGRRKEDWGIIKNQTQSLTKPKQIFDSVRDKI